MLEYLKKGELISLDGQLACALATGQLSYGERWSPEEIERDAYTGSNKRYSTWVARQFLALPGHSQSFRYDVQVWKLGNRLTVFGMEGEICSPWGPMLRSMARSHEAMVIGYANGTGSYIPDVRTAGIHPNHSRTILQNGYSLEPCRCHTGVYWRSLAFISGSLLL